MGELRVKGSKVKKERNGKGSTNPDRCNYLSSTGICLGRRIIIFVNIYMKSLLDYQRAPPPQISDHTKAHQARLRVAGTVLLRREWKNEALTSRSSFGNRSRTALSRTGHKWVMFQSHCASWAALGAKTPVPEGQPIPSSLCSHSSPASELQEE